MEFSWDDPPPTGHHPGEDYNCRCWAEPTRREGNAEPVYPELAIPVFLLRRTVAEGVARIGKAIDKIFKDPISKRPKGVPKEWKKVPSDNREGYKYVKPGSKGSTDVRVQKGKSDSPYPNSRKPYVRWKRDGRWLDKNGNPLPDKKDPRGHIPLEEFDFRKGKIK